MTAEAVAVGDGLDGLHVRRQAVHVDRHDGRCPVGDPLLDPIRIDVERARVDVAEHGTAPWCATAAAVEM